jgi:hypothetical protein
LIAELEPIALGELGLTPEQFGAYTIGEIDAMFDGYVRRSEHLEDLFIVYCAMPTMRGQVKRPPSYKKLTSHRRKRNTAAGEIDEDTQAYWRDILKGGVSCTREIPDALPKE